MRLMPTVDICPHFEAYLPTCGVCEGENLAVTNTPASQSTQLSHWYQLDELMSLGKLVCGHHQSQPHFQEWSSLI
jgi:hypothetical protein